jgi:hypothetical protein
MIGTIQLPTLGCKPPCTTAPRPAPVSPVQVQAPKPKPDPFADVYFGKYHALVIGNNRYPIMSCSKDN